MSEWKLGILIGLAVVFWGGGLGGFFLSRKVHSLALVYNAVFFFLIGVALTYHYIKRHGITLWQALIGAGKFGTMYKHVKAITESGNEVSDSELMELFDDLDDDGDSFIDQDELFLAITGKYDHIIKQNKNFFRILEDAWNESSDAGKNWKLSRDDWRRLVDQHSSTRHVTFSEPVLNSYGPASIRQASIAMMTQAGYVVYDDDIDDEKFDDSKK
eukprot:scaffold51512_cov56-Attheya_sp.AAC.1